MQSIPKTVQRTEVIGFYNPVTMQVSYNSFERKGISITKGQSFIVPKQEGTNAEISVDIVTTHKHPLLLFATDVTDTHILTDTHGAFSKDICWIKEDTVKS
jgi:hypothetical protein